MTIEKEMIKKNIKKPIKIAIDGPSGSGKSTVAKALAKDLGYEYIDTGAMYRAIGYKMSENNIPANDIEAIEKILEKTKIYFVRGDVYLDGKNIEGEIRNEHSGKIASNFAQIESVRKKLVSEQRMLGEKENVVMDGRDIGTNVFPDADFKFFLTALPEVRAKRRYDELKEKEASKEKGNLDKKADSVTFEEVLEDIKKRDYEDTHRKLNPLIEGRSSIKIDTGDMTIEEVIDFIKEKMI